MIPKNLDHIFSQINDHWAPRIIDRINTMDIKAVKFQGEFIWHSHDDTDELFYIHKGHPVISFRDTEVALSPGEFFVVPKGLDHKPSSEDECHALLIEPSGTINTGGVVNELSTSGDLFLLD